VDIDITEKFAARILKAPYESIWGMELQLHLFIISEEIFLFSKTFRLAMGPNQTSN